MTENIYKNRLTDGSLFLIDGSDIVFLRNLWLFFNLQNVVETKFHKPGLLEATLLMKVNTLGWWPSIYTATESGSSGAVALSSVPPMSSLPPIAPETLRKGRK